MKLFALVAAVSILAVGQAHARWDTTIEDEIFTGGKKAMLTGDISRDAFLVADCVTGERLTLAYAEAGEWNSAMGSVTVRLLVKVDGGQIHEFAANAGERNSTFLQFVTNDSDLIVPLLKDIAAAKTTILVGIQIAGSENKHSATIGAAGSTKSVRRFMEACGLN